MSNEKPDALRPIQDTRGFFMLPQGPVDAGYYTYGLMDGRPDRGGCSGLMSPDTSIGG